MVSKGRKTSSLAFDLHFFTYAMHVRHTAQNALSKLSPHKTGKTVKQHQSELNLSVKILQLPLR